MTLRKVPGSVVLGLLASLAVHAALYGGQHVVGGGYHALLLHIAQAAALGFVALIGALAWTQSGTSSDGSVLAARLRLRLPRVESVIAAAVLCYVVVEAVEPHHAGVSGIVMLAALVAASYAALRLAHVITDAFARTAIAIFCRTFSPRAPMWHRRSHGGPIPRSSFVAHRRFARPPPVAFASPRA